jgi:hypothetical protein
VLGIGFPHQPSCVIPRDDGFFFCAIGTPRHWRERFHPTFDFPGSARRCILIQIGSGALCSASLTSCRIPSKSAIAKLRDEIAELSETNGLHLLGGKNRPGAAGDHARRLQRLQEIMDELMALTDWKKL